MGNGFITTLAHMTLQLANMLIARDNKMIVYGDDDLNSSIYLFRYANRQRDDLRHIYITPHPELAESIRAAGLEAYEKKSIKAIFFASRATCYVLSGFPSQINKSFSHGAKVYNLWHGITVKKIGLMHTTSEKRAQKNKEKFKQFDIMPATSKMMQKCFCEAFDKPIESVPILGEPRNDFLINPADSEQQAINQEETTNTTIGYLPTWRDYGNWSPNIDFSDLNSFLQGNNANLIIKPHPRDSSFSGMKGFSNIEVHQKSNSWEDSYETLNRINILITDYSSLAYEFVLTRKPIILYTPDFNAFCQNRDFWIDYDEIAPSDRIETYEELKEAIKFSIAQEEPDEKYERARSILHEIDDPKSAELNYQELKRLINYTYPIA